MPISGYPGGVKAQSKTFHCNRIETCYHHPRRSSVSEVCTPQLFLVILNIHRAEPNPFGTSKVWHVSLLGLDRIQRSLLLDLLFQFRHGLCVPELVVFLLVMSESECDEKRRGFDDFWREE